MDNDFGVHESRLLENKDFTQLSSSFRESQRKDGKIISGSFYIICASSERPEVSPGIRLAPLILELNVESKDGKLAYDHFTFNYEGVCIAHAYQEDVKSRTPIKRDCLIDRAKPYRDSLQDLLEGDVEFHQMVLDDKNAPENTPHINAFAAFYSRIEKIQGLDLRAEAPEED